MPGLGVVERLEVFDKAGEFIVEFGAAVGDRLDVEILVFALPEIDDEF